MPFIEVAIATQEVVVPIKLKGDWETTRLIWSAASPAAGEKMV